MTSADNLSLILRRLDEIERNLDRMMEELMAPRAGLGNLHRTISGISA
jgi:tetrahydromethanopterin S-methyltransferase subunit G